MKKRIILSINFLLVVFLFLYFDSRQISQIMDVPRLTEQKIHLLKEERILFNDSVQTELLVNGVKAPWVEEEKCYYIPKNMNEDYWKGTLEASVNGIPSSAAWIDDSAFDNIQKSISNQHIFHCLIYNDSGYRQVSVLFTGLPIMCIEGEMGAQGTWMSVFDPIQNIHGGYQIDESSAYYNIRGKASKRFEKIGYRLELFHEDGSEGNNLSLLGMRSDNDWQLKAMYSDRSKLRDKLSIDLWNQIAERTETAADTGCHMEYLELIINGEYRGLYGLVEPTDYKSLGLDKTKDIIYKASADEWPNNSLFDASEEEHSFLCAGIKIRQAGKNYTSGMWEPFRIFWNNGYEMESKEDLETLYGCIDRQNFIDYELYYNAIAGVDNRFKNIIYSTVLNSDGTYTIRRIPWDQNYSWGDGFETGNNKDIKNIQYNPELAKKWMNEEVFKHMLEYDSALPKDMLATWQNWRETFLKEEYWKTYAQEQMKYLKNSGAFSRDTKKWPDSENAASTDEIEEFINTRFIWLDNYLSVLTS